MRLVLILGLIAFCDLSIRAQKPVIDSSVFGRWASVRAAAISADGRYAACAIDDNSVGRKSFVFKETNGNWEITYDGDFGKPFGFSRDSRSIVFSGLKDTLIILKNGSKTMFKIPRVNSYKLTDDYLAFQPDSARDKLILFSLNAVELGKYTAVSSYRFVHKG